MEEIKEAVEEWEDRELVEIAMDVVRQLEEGLLDIRMRRIRVAFEGELKNNDEDHVTDAEIERMAGLLDSYAFNRESLRRLSYGQMMLLDRYYAMYRVLADASLHFSVGSDRSRYDQIVSAVL